MFLLAGILVVGLLGWLSRMACRVEPWPEPMRHPHFCNRASGHSFTLHPITLDKLSCMLCPYDLPMPRGAPQKPPETIEWARVHGLLWGGGGRSAAFLEALGTIG